MAEKLDLRIRKTHKALLKALQELLCEKSFDEISVAELCERAEIRRATFYKHFGDKSELLAYMIQELQREYNAANEVDFYIQGLSSYLIAIFNYFLDFLDENRDMVRTILNSNAKNVVLDILSQQLELDLKMHFRASKQTDESGKIDPEMMAVLYSGAVVSCARWWITKEKQMPKNEILQQFAMLMKQF